MSGGATESFGKQWVPGDIVGVFLDLVDHTISKSSLQILEQPKSSKRYFCEQPQQPQPPKLCIFL